ncbi:MAG: hypothetical protein AB1442_16595, partial [Nitrospirota bacterium]
IRHLLRKTMWERVGIIRCADSLSEALTRLDSWAFILEGSFRTRRQLELKNMLTVARLIAESANLRKGSVGAHYRSDHPNKAEGWQNHMTFRRDGGEWKHEIVA